MAIAFSAFPKLCGIEGCRYNAPSPGALGGHRAKAHPGHVAKIKAASQGNGHATPTHDTPDAAADGTEAESEEFEETISDPELVLVHNCSLWFERIALDPQACARVADYLLQRFGASLSS